MELFHRLAILSSEPFTGILSVLGNTTKENTRSFSYDAHIILSDESGINAITNPRTATMFWENSDLSPCPGRGPGGRLEDHSVCPGKQPESRRNRPPPCNATGSEVELADRGQEVQSHQHQVKNILHRADTLRPSHLIRFLNDSHFIVRNRRGHRGQDSGGNSESIAANKALEVVELIGDGYTESLHNDFVLLADVPRSVSVYVRHHGSHGEVRPSHR